MRKPNPNSLRQRLIALKVGGEMVLKRSTGKSVEANQKEEEIKPGSLGSLLCAIKRDENQSYTYKTFPEKLVVTRLS